ncbi:MAG: hypothetical protein NTV86_17260 [Planctomycetota bacterium]|nr:hypothetical protein [Planctomycetota bacterium]
MSPAELILTGFLIVAITVALGATLAMLKQKNNTRRTDELELLVEAVARDVAVAYESLTGEISQMRQETSQAVLAEQEKLVALVNGLGGATNQVLRELAGAQEAQATAAEEARTQTAARQAELTALVTRVEARLTETAAALADLPRRPAKKAEPAPAAPEAPAPAPTPVAEPEAPEHEEPQPEPARAPTREPLREPVRESDREPAGKRMPARKAVGKKSVRKTPR